MEIQIREGKNRQVRKMFAAVGNRVQELKRTAIGNIHLGRWMEGHIRKLSLEEIGVPEKSLDLISLIVYRDLTVFAGDPIMSFASGFVSEYFS